MVVWKGMLFGDHHKSNQSQPSIIMGDTQSYVRWGIEGTTESLPIQTPFRLNHSKTWIVTTASWFCEVGLLNSEKVASAYGTSLTNLASQLQQWKGGPDGGRKAEMCATWVSVENLLLRHLCAKCYTYTHFTQTGQECPAPFCGSCSYPHIHSKCVCRL